MVLIDRKTRSDAKLYEYDGKTMTLLDWSRYLDVSVRTLQRRLAEGKTGEEVFHGSDNERK